MRNVRWLGAALLAAALVLPVIAQRTSGQTPASQFFTGANPRQINSPKIDPVKAMRRTDLGKAMQTNATQRPSGVLSLGSYFPKVTLGSWPPKLPSFVATKTPPAPQVSTVQKGGVNLLPLPK